MSKSWPYLNSTTQATFAQLIPDESQLTVEVLNLFLNFTELKICYFQDLPQDSLELQARIQVKVLPSCPRLSWRKHLKVLTKWAQYKSKVRQQRFLSTRPWAHTSTVRRWTGNKWNCPSPAPWNTLRAWRWRKIILFLLPVEGKKALENTQAPIQTGKMNSRVGKVREESSTKSARQNAQLFFLFFFFPHTYTPHFPSVPNLQFVSEKSSQYFKRCLVCLVMTISFLLPLPTDAWPGGQSTTANFRVCWLEVWY